VISPMGGPEYLWPFVLAFAIGYLIGSVPFGLILAKVSGAGDVRAIGSGNIGATNVLRTGRKGLALATLLLDAAKGALPAGLGHAWLGPDIAVLAALGAVLGHCFPVWLLFRGGKGVATAAGVVFALSPLTGLLAAVVFAAAAALTRHVSVGSMLAALAAPPIAWAFGHVQLAELYLLIALVIIVKHAGNIRRLLNGTESRFTLRR
jgi:acyl phosphate:glycerol-3-phosphate acyltransferase